MDGSPRVTDVTFDQAKRGYDPEQVDAYLEELDQVVAELRRSWRSALDRADSLESSLAQVGSQVQQTSEETVARTLVLAQRTADEAIAEARTEARTIVEAATADVAALLAEAQSARDDARREARAEVEELLAQARGAIEEDVAELSAQRDVLSHDVALLEEHLAVQRARLRTALGQLQKLVDLPETFRLDETPELESMDPPMAPAPVRTDATPRMVRRPSAQGSATITSLPTRSDTGLDDATTGDDAVVVAPTAPPAAVSAAIEEQQQASAPTPELPARTVQEPAATIDEPAAVTPDLAELDADEVADDEVAEAEAVSMPAAVLAPPDPQAQVELPEPGVATVADLTARRATQVAEERIAAAAEVAAADGADELDESFLNELRRAVNDDGGLPAPVDAAEDEAMRAFFDTDIDEPRRSRFGRRS